MDPSPNPTRELCRFLADFTYEAVPAGVKVRTKDLLIDHFGVGLLGALQPASVVVREVVAARGGVSESSVFVAPHKLPRAAAALLNAAAAHSVSLDDMHGESFTHPGSVVIAAALATAESVKASPPEFLSAVIAGYEAQGRVGAAASRALSRGFHPTAVSGVFGAAAAAGRLLRLDRDGIESAFGIALSMASGTMQFAHDPRTTVKRLHAGLPAQSGVFAAELAAAGMQGPGGSLHGAAGLIQVFSGGGGVSRLTEDLGISWEVEKVGIKLYACCRFFHAPIDALLAIRARHHFDANEIATISVGAPSMALDGHMEYRPKSTPSAQYSLPYALAVAMLLDPRDPESFAEHSIARADLLSMMDRVNGALDPELEAHASLAFGGRIQVLLKDGRLLSELRTDALGAPSLPVDATGIDSKFRVLTSRMGPREWQDNLIREIRELDRATSLERLIGMVDSSLIDSIKMRELASHSTRGIP